MNVSINAPKSVKFRANLVPADDPAPSARLIRVVGDFHATPHL